MKDLNEQIARKRTVALYASLTMAEFYMLWEVRYSGMDERYTPLPDGEEREIPVENYVRVSEPIELTFNAIATDAVVQNAVASLDAAERKAIQDLNTKVAAIREQKRQLLALTHQTEEA